MKAFFDIGREDIRPLISKFGSRFGFGVAVPFTGYLAANHEEETSPNNFSVNAPSRAACKSPIESLNVPGRGLNHQLFIQQNEEALANIFHGNNASTVSNTATKTCDFLRIGRQSSLDELQECPEPKRLNWGNLEHELPHRSADRSLQSDRSDDDDEESCEIEDGSMQNGIEKRLLEYFGGDEKRTDDAKMERKFVKIDMNDERLYLSPKIPWGYESREMVKHLDAMFMNLKRSLKLDLPQTRALVVAALEYKTELQDDQRQNEDGINADDENKTEEESEPLKDDSSNQSMPSSNIELDSNIEQIADCTDIVQSSSYSIKVQENDSNESSESGAEDDNWTCDSSDSSITSTASPEAINYQVDDEEKFDQIDPKLPSPNKKEKAKKPKIVKALMNAVKRRSSRKVFDSDDDSSFHSNAASSTTSTVNSVSSGEAKAIKSSGSKLISSIVRHLPGKHGRRKSSKTDSSYNGSENSEVVRAGHSVKSVDSLSYRSISSEASIEKSSTEQLSGKICADNCWESESAWCRNAFRSPIGISSGQQRRKLGDYLKFKD